VSLGFYYVSRNNSFNELQRTLLDIVSQNNYLKNLLADFKAAIAKGATIERLKSML